MRTIIITSIIIITSLIDLMKIITCMTFDIVMHIYCSQTLQPHKIIYLSLFLKKSQFPKKLEKLPNLTEKNN